ncbi:MAG: TetR/AcrR family transcriptional regulator [Polyangiales bacterium]
MSTAPAKKSAARLAREAAYRTVVVDAAERVFADKGYDGAKIKDVADEAGIALGTVYTLYPSKHDVFVAVHLQRGTALLERVMAAIETLDAPFDALERALHAACAFYAEHPAYLRMHLQRGDSWASPGKDAEEEAAIFGSAVAPLVALFTSAAERGELVDERPETCARLLLTSMQVLLGEWVDEGFASPRERVAERIVRHARRSFERRRA